MQPKRRPEICGISQARQRAKFAELGLAQVTPFALTQAIGRDVPEGDADELEHRGPIGFKNSTQQYLKFPEAIMEIDKTCKDLVTKLYTGDNAKHLVGDDKIPEYLSIFLDNMHR